MASDYRIGGGWRAVRSSQSFPDTFEVDEIGFHCHAGDSGAQIAGGAVEFVAVMLGFGGGVVLEGLEAAVGSAVRVNHQNHALGTVQTDRFTNLVEDEFAVGLRLRRRQALGAAGDLDRVGIDDSGALEILSKAEIE